MGGNELLVVLGTRANWKRFRPLIKEYVLRKEHKALVDGLEVYYKNNPTIDEVNWGTFETWFLTVRASHLTAPEAKAYQMILDRVVKDTAEGTVDTHDVMEYYVKLDYTARAQTKVNDILRDQSIPLDDVAMIVQDYHKEVGRVLTKNDVFVEQDLTTLFASVSEPGFDWRLPFLNRAAGPLRRGDFVIFAARPETGKTTFIASEVCNFAAQALNRPRPIIWVNNEERSDKVSLRIAQALFQEDARVILADAAAYEAKRRAAVPDGRLEVLAQDKGINSVASLDLLFEEFNPCMIIFDQLDKVDGFNGEVREDVRLGKLYGWGRQCAAKYGPVIAISQLSEGADDILYPSYSFLRGSKTDKAGEADLIITMGRDRGKGEYARGIHLPKNKLFGSATTNEAERHGKCELLIVPDKVYFEEV